MAARPLPLPTRLAAWLYTGPLGHLYGGLLDWASLLGRLLWMRVRARTGR
ncbi:hypothetical protein [Baekduia soli]|nr:hypothetical protein [Baekduia soli]